jgi:hypothetical protein
VDVVALGAGPPTRQLPILTSSSQLPTPAAATSIRTSSAAGGASSSTSRISTGSPSAVAHEVAHAILGHGIGEDEPSQDAIEAEARALVREWGFTGVGAAEL